MRLGIDTTACSSDLDKHIKEMITNLEDMVARAAGKLAEVASENTPVVDADNIVEGGKFRNLYEQREQDYDIDIDQGFHAGAWRYAESDYTLDPTIYPLESVGQTAYKRALSGYKLGETFYISAKGPAFVALERGDSFKAPQGISKPTVDQIIDIYKMNLQSYYG